jgi:hypothetical protein
LGANKSISLWGQGRKSLWNEIQEQIYCPITFRVTLERQRLIHVPFAVTSSGSAFRQLSGMKNEVAAEKRTEKCVLPEVEYKPELVLGKF